MRIVKFLLVIVLFLTPQLALAWGPGMHLEIALTVLDKLALISPAIAALIARHRRHFIYGSVAPDIQMGKRVMDYMHHCHTWKMGSLILSEAKTGAEKAAAYGYLTHLAADTVAHSYYVPYKLVEWYRSRMPDAHIYWEMRFDRTIDPAHWEALDDLLDHSYDDFNGLLDRVLSKTLFSLGAHRQVFKGVLSVQRFKRLRHGLSLYHRASRMKLGESEVDHFRQLTYDYVLDFLKNPEHAKAVKADPTGLLRISEATEVRRRLRRLVRQKVVVHDDLIPYVGAIRQTLERGLGHSLIKWPNVSDWTNRT